MKPKAYIETSIVSYLTAWPSRDLVLAAHQQVTRDWWASRETFGLFASQFVLDEAAAGDVEAAASRLSTVMDMTVLEVTEDAIVLAERLIGGGGLPSQARIDALQGDAANDAASLQQAALGRGRQHRDVCWSTNRSTTARRVLTMTLPTWFP